MKLNNSRCLTRGFRPEAAESSARKEVLAQVLRAGTFTELSQLLDNSPSRPEEARTHTFPRVGGGLHAIGHRGVGGEVRFI